MAIAARRAGQVEKHLVGKEGEIDGRGVRSEAAHDVVGPEPRPIRRVGINLLRKLQAGRAEVGFVQFFFAALHLDELLVGVVAEVDVLDLVEVDGRNEPLNALFLIGKAGGYEPGLRQLNLRLGTDRKLLFEFVFPVRIEAGRDFERVLQKPKDLHGDPIGNCKIVSLGLGDLPAACATYEARMYLRRCSASNAPKLPSFAAAMSAASVDAPRPPTSDGGLGARGFSSGACSLGFGSCIDP